MTNRNRHDPYTNDVGRQAGAFAQVKFRDRSIRSLDVPCPTCDQPADAQCVNAAGAPSRTPHGSRRRMAIRKLNDNYSVADCEYATFLGPTLRRAIREATGVSVSPLARTFGLDPSTLRRYETQRATVTGPAGARYGAWLRENRAIAEVREAAKRQRIRDELEGRGNGG